MNCDQANKISIIDFLNSRGYVATIKGNSCWYAIRDEATPSTKIDISINRWFDYGINKGGKLVDLVCCYFTNNDIKEALEIIGGNPITHTPQHTIIHQNTVEIIKIIDVEHKALKDYLNERKIFDFFQDKISEIHYKIGDSVYFSLGWQNDSGGWNCRNKFLKNCINKNGITTVLGEQHNDILDIWEGMFSFLSYLQYHEQPNKVIVLNSVMNVNKAILGIEKYKQVNIYLDNDKAGKEATMLLKSVRNDVVDCSNEYKGFKDYNEYLIDYESRQIY